MNIALIIQRFDERAGGAERACVALARELAARGQEVHVYARRFGAEVAGVRPHEVPAAAVLPGQRHVSFARNVASALREARYDVVCSFARTHSQDVLRMGGGVHREYLRRTARGWWTWWNPKERAILRLERRAIEATSGPIVAVSRSVREEVLANYPVAPERVVVIPNGVDVRRFHPRLREERRAEVRRRYTLGEEEFLVLFLGTGFRRKGLDTAIAAVAAIPGTQRVRLLVGGRGDVQEWRRLARRLKALDRVLFLGPVDRPEDLYAASDVLVLPTRYDPFPNVVLEAMACGLPVVTTRAAGVVDLLRDGEDALVIESAEEPHRLEAALRRLMDPAVAARIGNAARATAERHSLDRFASDYLRVFGAAGS